MYRTTLRFILICICVGTSLGSAYVAMTGGGSRQAVLEVTPQEYDFGFVKQGERRTYTISLVNHCSRDPVHIVKVLTTCSCAASKLDNPVIQPGEAA